MLKLRSRKAFTLLELVVALVVLGILAALAVPTYITVIDNAKVAVATSTATSVATDAVAIASSSHYNQPATAADLATAVSVGEGATATLGAVTDGTGLLTAPYTADTTSSLVKAQIIVNGETICIDFPGTINGAPTVGSDC